MRECTKCKQIKPQDEFYKQTYNNESRKNREGSWCKSCMKNQTVQRQHRYKQAALDYKGSKCQKCGFDKYQGALEFHHLDPKLKDFKMSKFSRHPLTDKGREELDKCILLCSNCHKMTHAGLI